MVAEVATTAAVVAVKDRLKGGGRNLNRDGRGEGHQTATGCYYWTHGNGSHAGLVCKNRADGHKVDATLVNMQGGSQVGCT